MEKTNLPKDLNREAWMTCVKSIALFPQASAGSCLIADKVMDSFYEGVLTPVVMANIKPDPEECTKKVNEIHKLFNISSIKHVERQITPAEAVAFTLSFAFNSLEDIQIKTRLVANELEVEIPEEIYNDIVLEDGDRRDTTQDMINHQVVQSLQTFLELNPRICDSVRDRIKTEANLYRSRSAAQRDYIAKHHHS